MPARLKLRDDERDSEPQRRTHGPGGVQRQLSVWGIKPRTANRRAPFGHASRSTRTSHAADAGDAINLSTDSMSMEIPAFRGSNTDALRGVPAEASLLFDDVVEIAEPS